MFFKVEINSLKFLFLLLAIFANCFTILRQSDGKVLLTTVRCDM